MQERQLKIIKKLCTLKKKKNLTGPLKCLRSQLEINHSDLKSKTREIKVALYTKIALKY